MLQHAPSEPVTRYYIGLANTVHDPAIAIVGEDGVIRFAEAIERPTQCKRGWFQPPDALTGLPALIEEHCEPHAEFVVGTSWSRAWALFTALQTALSPLPIERLLGANADQDPPAARFAFRLRWIYRRLFQGGLLTGDNLRYQLRIRYGNRRVSFRHYAHHRTHAAYACMTSPFDDALCAVVDGVGEFGNLSYFRWEGRSLRRLKHCWKFGSLGLIYSAVTEWCGFDPLKGEEWKVMGLAPYGAVDPTVYGLLDGLARVDDLDLSVPSLRGLRRSLEALERLAVPPGSEPLEAADLARTGQQFYADRLTELLDNLHRRGGSDNLVLAGGCALNSSYNGRVLDRTSFSALSVPSAPGDDGNAIGAALLAWQEDHPGHAPPTGFVTPYLGSTIAPASVDALVEHGRLTGLTDLGDGLCAEVARRLADGQLVGWVQGRAEFGPRALGNRSLLADPRRADMKAIVNARVKFREAFRPFAPSILDEHGPDWFVDYVTAPYMERTQVWRPELQERVPAVVHNDGTGRAQSVRREWNPRFWDLIEAFRQMTGVPVLLNTSLNVMGRPIVHSVQDAIGVFFTSGIDVLVLGDRLLTKD